MSTRQKALFAIAALVLLGGLALVARVLWFAPPDLDVGSVRSVTLHRVAYCPGTPWMQWQTRIGDTWFAEVPPFGETHPETIALNGSLRITSSRQVSGIAPASGLDPHAKLITGTFRSRGWSIALSTTAGLHSCPIRG